MFMRPSLCHFVVTVVKILITITIILFPIKYAINANNSNVISAKSINLIKKNSKQLSSKTKKMRN